MVMAILPGDRLKEIARRFAHHVGEVWEELARASVPAQELFGKTWGPASLWWRP